MTRLDDPLFCCSIADKPVIVDIDDMDGLDKIVTIRYTDYAIEKHEDESEIILAEDDESFLKIIFDSVVFGLLRWSILISVAQVIFLTILLCQFKVSSRNENPYLGPSVDVLIRFGAKDSELIIQHMEYWRLLSAIMLHAGVYHLLSNVFLQLIISGFLEEKWGGKVYFAVYFSSGIVGYLFSCCFLYESISVGSSGSIMGLLSLWLVDMVFLFERTRSADTSEKIMFSSLAIVIIITLASGNNNGVDWASHSGGCLYGAVTSCVLNTKYSNEESHLKLPSIESKFRCPGIGKNLFRRNIHVISTVLLFLIPIIVFSFMIQKKM